MKLKGWGKLIFLVNKKFHQKKSKKINNSYFYDSLLTFNPWIFDMKTVFWNFSPAECSRFSLKIIPMCQFRRQFWLEISLWIHFSLFYYKKIKISFFEKSYSVLLYTSLKLYSFNLLSFFFEKSYSVLLYIFLKRYFHLSLLHGQYSFYKKAV